MTQMHITKQMTEFIQAKELQHHNKVMEDIAMKEQELKKRKDSFEFKLKRIEHYFSLKGTFAPELIGALSSELKDLVDADALSSFGTRWQLIKALNVVDRKCN